MKSFKQFLEESLKPQLEENKKEFLAKNANEQNMQETFDRFWNIVRHRVRQPYNDINYWQNKPFAEFQSFVNSVDTTPKYERHAKEDLDISMQAEDAGAIKLDVEDGYEFWYVPTYISVKLLGRNYKRRPAKWCIASDDDSWWSEEHENDEFILAIRENPCLDPYDKVAIQIVNGVGPAVAWNLVNSYEFYAHQDLIEHLKAHALELYSQSGLSREKFKPDNDEY